MAVKTISVDGANVIAVVGKDGTITHRQIDEPNSRVDSKVDLNGAQAVVSVMTYIEQVAKVYDIDERWILQRVNKKMEQKVYD